MQLNDALKQRRSIRKYTNQPVAETLVLEVLEAAGWAPSAHNSQPWRFIILRNAQVKRELAERMAEAWAADLKKDGVTAEEEKYIEKRERFANAPVLILACLTMEGRHRFPDVERQACERDLALESLGAGLENLLLAAHMAGLGACWFCAPAFCKDTVRKVLKIPEGVEPSALIMLGYPAETPTTPVRKPLKDYCYCDVWGAPI
ncbi:MAG: nitroreductase family protein [Candidatus Bathyarchaeia archaeon]|jgi:F420 biosynthesis protein FbiB-like protein